MDLNKVSLIGNLANDPESKTLPSGQNLSLFRLATNYAWRDASTKEKKSRADFHQIVAWGHLAEIINIYLKKGVLAKGNQELVQKVLEKAKKLGRKLASQEETKKILGLY